jgi:hypothetical protein
MDERILIKFIIHTLITSTSVVYVEMFSLANIHVKVIAWYTQTVARQLLVPAPPLPLCLMYYNKAGNVRRTPNAEARSCNHCCGGKAITITYSGNVVYPACNGHAPYCHLWSIRLHNISPHYLTNRTIFGKKLLNTKCVF